MSPTEKLCEADKKLSSERNHLGSVHDPTASLLPDGILSLLLRLWRHLSSKRQRQFWLVLALMLVSAFAEIISLSAVLPFLGILIAPDKVFEHPLVANAVQALGITSTDQLVLPLTIAFVAAVIVAGAVRLLLLWVSTRFSFASGTDISVNMYQRTLYQPYSLHVVRNSSEMISGITNKVNHSVTVLSNLLLLISSTLLLVGIMCALIVIDPVVALISF